MSGAAGWQTAVVASTRPLTPRIRSVVLRLPHPRPFAAGQHADVRLTAEDGYVAQRSYSIASAPESPEHIELAVERLDTGEVSPFFHDVVSVGDEIELRLPLGGHFVWRASDGGPLLLIGAGSGVVPLVAMIRHHRVAAPEVPVALVLSARSWIEAPFIDELRALHRGHGGFSMVLALTREPAPSTRESTSEPMHAPSQEGPLVDAVPVYRHRLDRTVLARALSTLPGLPRHVFVCGSSGFVDSATDVAVVLGVPAATIRTERYGA